LPLQIALAPKFLFNGASSGSANNGAYLARLETPVDEVFANSHSGAVRAGDLACVQIDQLSKAAFIQKA
jgi:hypothetical protein